MQNARGAAAYRARICIVSSGSLSSGPRVVKEADALSSAGYAVHVLVCHTLAWQSDWDLKLTQGKRWSYDVVRWPPRPQGSRRARALSWTGRAAVRAIHEGARRAVERLGPRQPLLDLASSEAFLPLSRRARTLEADLVIAHNLGALPIAAALAKRAHAPLAFDAEDDHLGEHCLDPDGEALSKAARVVDALQAEYLRRCAQVTAASQGIADLLQARYGIAAPTVVHNVFPLSDREALDGKTRDRAGDAPSLYWYSQSLGLDRGLSDLLRAAALLHGDFQVHLRGHATPEVRAALLTLARDLGVQERVHLHPQVHPSELLSRSAEHDIGLALEQPVSRNRMHTVTNKLFFYMLAGLAIAATDTPGQQRIMRTVPDAGFVYAPGDARALARQLQPLLDDRSALARMRAAALQAAQTQWSWERESERLLARVRATLARSGDA